MGSARVCSLQRLTLRMLGCHQTVADILARCGQCQMVEVMLDQGADVHMALRATAMDGCAAVIPFLRRQTPDLQACAVGCMALYAAARCMQT